MKQDLAKAQVPISASTQPPAQAKRGLLYVCTAVFFFATSPIFVRWSQPFTSVEIAFWRLTIATALVATMGLLTHQPIWLKRQELPRFLFYGLVTALHFVFYIASLSFTTIAHSLAIVYTSPIFVTLFSVVILREPLAIRQYLG
ncbi:MAG TPA: DMT family transporter, partial [Ktedonobacteraceae bacterium]|nr:DMT family transporter [Ktedonobacteraceae bacterium]